MPWIDDGVLGELHDLAADGVRDLAHRAAPQIGAADASGEKRVSGEKAGSGHKDGAGIFRQVEADAAGRVARGMDYAGLKRAPTKRVALFQELVNVGDFRRCNAEERGLHLHSLIQRKIVAMHEDGRAGVLMELAEAADVVDVSVRADDGFDGQPMTTEELEDARDFVARIDDQCFARDGIADDGAIALQHTDRNGDVDEPLRKGVESWNCVRHIFGV